MKRIDFVKKINAEFIESHPAFPSDYYSSDIGEIEEQGSAGTRITRFNIEHVAKPIWSDGENMFHDAELQQPLTELPDIQ